MSNFWPTWLHFGGSHDLWIRLICQSSSQNSGKHLLMFPNLLKDMVEVTDEQQDEDTQGEVWKGPEGGGFFPCGVGVHHLPGHECVHPPGISLYPVLLGFLWRLHHVGTREIINSICSPSLFSREWKTGLKIPGF